MGDIKQGILRRWRLVTVIGTLVFLLAVVGHLALPLVPPDGLKPTRPPAKPGLPNIILFNADDLGYFDVGFHGNPVIQTPNLDRFAAEGVTFSAFYAASPLCSPSRAGLMTGRFPNRTGVYDAVKGFAEMHLHESEITIAELLQKAGYETLQVGKWHLSDWRKNRGIRWRLRESYGFDYSIEYPAMLAWQVVSMTKDWLERTRDPDRPFFCYLAPFEPHAPTESFAPTAYRKPYETPESEEAAKLIPYSGFTRPNAKPELRSSYFGAITQMDDAFGDLLAYLDKKGLRENTFILFTSDNGPERTSTSSFGSPGPFTGCKLKVFEGGIRVPGVVHWPRAMTPGLQVDEAVHAVDILPTLCELAQVPLPVDRPIDGTSILPLLSGGTVQRKTPLYWSYWAAPPRRPVGREFGAGGMQAALRDGNWKILGRLEPLSPEQSVMDQIRQTRFDAFELYDLAKDPAESNDLAEAKPEALERLKSKLIKLHKEVSAEGPSWDLEHFRFKAQTGRRRK